MTALYTVAPDAVELSTLPTVTLAELLATASLQTRVDRKYLLPAGDLAGVLAGADAGLRVLAIEGRTEFGYSSTYFDDLALDSFYRAGRGRRRRFTVRTRVYRDSGETWLEVKTRSGRGETVKDRLPYDLADAGRLTAEAEEFVAATFSARGAGEVNPADLLPVLHTRYRRTTLLVTPQGIASGGRYRTGHGVPTSRATVDTGLTWRRPGSSESLSLPDQVIVETKGGTAPSPLDRALWWAGTRPSRVSKYGVGLAALAELPELKWHRVVDRYLRPGTALAGDQRPTSALPGRTGVPGDPGRSTPAGRTVQ